MALALVAVLVVLSAIVFLLLMQSGVFAAIYPHGTPVHHMFAAVYPHGKPIPAVFYPHG